MASSMLDHARRVSTQGRPAKPRTPLPRVVVRDGNRIHFISRVNAHAHRQFMWCIHDCRERGYQDIVLDFSRCESAFPNGMIPLLSNADALRREKIDVSVTLPDKEDLARLFLNTNWAHFLEPARFPKSDTTHDRHLVVRHVTICGHGHGLQRAIIDESQHRTPERLIMAQH